MSKTSVRVGSIVEFQLDSIIEFHMSLRLGPDLFYIDPLGVRTRLCRRELDTWRALVWADPRQYANQDQRASTSQ